jgi:hypothetical protein
VCFISDQNLSDTIDVYLKTSQYASTKPHLAYGFSGMEINKECAGRHEFQSSSDPSLNNHKRYERPTVRSPEHYPSRLRYSASMEVDS